MLFVTHDIEEAIFVAGRVVVMSARPGRIKAEVAVDLPHPRLYTVKTTPEFSALKARLTEEIRGEALAAAPQARGNWKSVLAVRLNACLRINARDRLTVRNRPNADGGNHAPIHCKAVILLKLGDPLAMTTHWRLRPGMATLGGKFAPIAFLVV